MTFEGKRALNLFEFLFVDFKILRLNHRTASTTKPLSLPKFTSSSTRLKFAGHLNLSSGHWCLTKKPRSNGEISRSSQGLRSEKEGSPKLKGALLRSLPGAILFCLLVTVLGSNPKLSNFA